MRVLIAVTHLLGAGHLTRAAAIGRALAKTGHAVTLVSGGRPAPLIRTEGLDLVQLPPVRATAADLRTLLDDDGRPADAAYLAVRRERLLAAFHNSRPDVVVTELFPFGRRSLWEEFAALVEVAHERRDRPAVACSVRDILSSPSSPAKAERTHAILRNRYDAVLVHADPSLIRLEKSWPVDPGLGPLLGYTGFIDPEPDPPRPSACGTTIVVSGGSSEAGLPLYRAALGAAALRPGLTWRVLVGPGVPGGDVESLRAAAPANAAVEPARPGFREVLAEAAVFVGQSGYNTCLDIIASRCRALLVPFEGNGETEQRLRAERLAAAGLASVVPEGELSAASLAAGVDAALARPTPPVLAVDRDGLAAYVRQLEELARRQGVSP